MQRAARCLGAATITLSRGDSGPGLGSSSEAGEMYLDSLLKEGHDVVEEGRGGSGGVRVGFDRVKRACHLDVRVEVRWGQLRQQG